MFISSCYIVPYMYTILFVHFSFFLIHCFRPQQQRSPSKRPQRRASDWTRPNPSDVDSEAGLSVLSAGELHFNMEEEFKRAGLADVPDLHSPGEMHVDDNFDISSAIGVSSRKKLFDLRNQIIHSKSRSIEAIGTRRRR